MRRILIFRVIMVLIVASLLLSMAGPVAAQDPISLDEVRSYVVVLGDGRLDVRYTVTFTEQESGGRDRFAAVGRFITPLEFVSGEGSGPAGAFQVTVSPTDRPSEEPFPEFMQVNFPRTERGQQYSVTVRYRVNRSVFDETTYQGASYRALGFAPPQWPLAIKKQMIDFVLPIELPAGIDQPEKVTDAVVDATGYLSDPSSQKFDRWVFYPTPMSPLARRTCRCVWKRTTCRLPAR